MTLPDRVPDDPRITALGDGHDFEPCPDCDESGLIDKDGDRITCPRCNGEGYLP